MKALTTRMLAILLLITLFSGASLPALAQAPTPSPTALQAEAPRITLGRTGSSAPLRAAAPGDASTRALAPDDKPGFLGRHPAPGLSSASAMRLPAAADAALQIAAPGAATVAIGANFDGIANPLGYVPPDTVGEVGPNHFVQMVNVHFAIYDKTGVKLAGPYAFSQLFAGFGGPCESSNDGDPIVVYDQLADRWVLSQFSLPNVTSYAYAGPYYECIAVSKTGDPTGAYHLYEFKISDTKMNDYPKLGVWPDGYYMSVNQFSSGTTPSYAGIGVVAFERDKMLNGQTARMVYFDLYSSQPDLFGMLPADLDGSRQPPAGAPVPFALYGNDGSQWNRLSLWKFHVDWSSPAASTFTYDTDLAVTQFDPYVCSSAYESICIPQPGIRSLDSISDRLMFRLQYRNFSDHQSLVVNHTVDASGAGRAGVRWYELRKTSDAWSVYQQGTYSPDAHHRWMGSAALNGQGDLALGYSVSSSTLYPSIRVTGRFAEDTPGQMTQVETTLVSGAGSQSHSAGRWGDYSDLTVDPADDCTFWYTNEYYASSSSSNWRTRISAFRLRDCTANTRGTLQGVVTMLSAPGDPIAGAQVDALQEGVVIGGTVTQSDGSYALLLDPGTYDVRVSAYGFQTATVNGAIIPAGGALTQNFQLAAASMHTISGVVRDAVTGWGLYARLDIENNPNNPVWTDPATGAYSVELPGSIELGLQAEAFVTGYQIASQTIGPFSGDDVVNIDLFADPAACNAPGYALQNGSLDCLPGTGGLVVGVVTDANTGEGLVDAVVTAGSNASAASVATPLDPNLLDGFYWLFRPAGVSSLLASRAGYAGESAAPAEALNQTIRQDFALTAPRLTFNLSEINETLKAGDIKTIPLTLENTGSATASFNLIQTLPATLAVGPIEQPNYAIKPFKLHGPTAEKVKLPITLPDAPTYTYGDVVTLSPAGAAHTWGLAVDSASGHLWLSSPDAAWGGEDRLAEYSLNGNPTGRTYDYTFTHSFGPADAAFNRQTRSVWVLGAGAPGCIQELNPTSGETGRSICTTAAEDMLRGLAYDPVTATWFAGGWGDGMIYRFGNDGALLSRVNTGLPIAGLAYHPITQRLFVMTSAAGSPVYVLDAAHSYALLGKFTIPGFSDYGGAGLDLDNRSRLWALDQKTGVVHRVQTLEGAWVAAPTTVWLSFTPGSGMLAPGASVAVEVTLDATWLSPGNYHAALLAAYTGPYGIPSLPVGLTVSAFPTTLRLPFILHP